MESVVCSGIEIFLPRHFYYIMSLYAISMCSASLVPVFMLVKLMDDHQFLSKKLQMEAAKNRHCTEQLRLLNRRVNFLTLNCVFNGKKLNFDNMNILDGDSDKSKTHSGSSSNSSSSSSSSCSDDSD